MPPTQYLDLARHELEAWQQVASVHGWNIKSLTVWVEGEQVRDSVATRDGEDCVYIVDYNTEELLPAISIGSLIPTRIVSGR